MPRSGGEVALIFLHQTSNFKRQTLRHANPFLVVHGEAAFFYVVEVEARVVFRQFLQAFDEAVGLFQGEVVAFAGEDPEDFVAFGRGLEFFFAFAVCEVDDEVHALGIGVGKDRGVGRAAADVEAAAHIVHGADRVGAADFVVTFGDDDFVVVAAHEVQDFADGLAEFGVCDAAADVEADEDFRRVRAQLARQVQSFGLAAVAAHGRLFPGAGDGADEALQIPVPGQVFFAVLEGLDHAFQIVREFALARRVDVFFREFAQRLFVDVVAFVPEVMRRGRVVGNGDGFVRFAFRFGQVFLVRAQVQGGLDLVDVVFQAFEGLEEERIVHIDPGQGRREGRQMVEVGVDDDVHGQVDGHLAVLAAQVFGPQEMEGDDVQDFVFDRAFHLLRREGQEEHGVEIDVIARALEVDACRRGHVEADFLDHLEEEVAEEVVLVFHELAVDAVQEGIELPLEGHGDIRNLARRALFVEDDVGNDGCLLIEEIGRNGQ